jgi:hypothetical protein
MYRSDGSIDSANNPISGNRYAIRDFGLYKAQVVNVLYADAPENNTASDKNPQVLYEVRIMGGSRDGQIFRNVTELQLAGGISNYSEHVWKGTTTLTRQDVASVLNIESYAELNGDIVYIQFINGEVNYPVIIGGSKHGSNNFPAATIADGPRKISKFNGITQAITKDGEFSWTKANGFYTPAPFPNPTGTPLFLQDQFVELPGFEEAFKITLGNEFDFSMKMNVTPGNGIEVLINGTEDKFTVKTLLGSTLTMDGLNDFLNYTTVAGLALKIDGLGDLFSITGVAGAGFTLDGVSDAFSVITAAGTKLEVSGPSGITMENSTGDKLALATGAVELANAAGAMLAFDPAGFIKLGNSSGDVLAILGEAFEALGTQTAAGFGAPTSTVATFVQLAVKLKLISG